MIKSLDLILTQAAKKVSIITTNKEGIINSFNLGAKEMLGYSASEVVGSYTPEIFHLKSELVKRAEELNGEYKGFGIVVAYHKKDDYNLNEWRYVKKDGDQITVELFVHEIKNEKGQLIGYLNVAKDISRYIQKQGQERLLSILSPTNSLASDGDLRSLKGAICQAEMANKAKRELLSNITHEIQTPLMGILGNAEHLLSRDSLEDKEIIQDIFRCSKYLSELIKEFLDYSRLENGKLNLVNEEFDLGTLALEVESIIGIEAEKKGVNLRVEYVEGIPIKYMGDATKIKQVLINLGKNAIKFTEEGYVNIGIEGKKEEEKYKLNFYVEDTGIGIKRDRLEDIFDRFIQADISIQKKYGGTGLGLEISRKLVELMGGSLYVESEEGKGSKFYFSLYLDEA